MCPDDLACFGELSQCLACVLIGAIRCFLITCLPAEKSIRPNSVTGSSACSVTSRSTAPPPLAARGSDGRLKLHCLPNRCPSESLPDRIGVHTNLFWVACRSSWSLVILCLSGHCDPGLNRTYAEMASRYGTRYSGQRPRQLRYKLHSAGSWRSCRRQVAMIDRSTSVGQRQPAHLAIVSKTNMRKCLRSNRRCRAK